MQAQQHSMAFVARELAPAGARSGPKRLRLGRSVFAYRTARVLQFFGPGVLMAKMAIFLGGFLALTLLIGVLATISPV